MLLNAAPCPADGEVEPAVRDLGPVHLGDDHVDLDVLDAADLERVDDVVHVAADRAGGDPGDRVGVLRAGDVPAQDDHVADAGQNVHGGRRHGPPDHLPQQV